uniref:Shugoshin 1 n=1 Tax=Zea mays TaxID=4577 RepID=A0A804Q6C3_MAIZE
MTSTAAGSGSLNPPHSNPSGDGGPRIRSPPGKGNKPVALADITNTGKPNAARSITVPDLVKENTKLLTLLNEKTKIIDLSRVEIYKLRLALQASKQQNLHLTQTNSQMLAEINTGKDRIKMLQHELSCTTALLKVKDSELDRKKNAGNVQQKGVKSQVLKTKASTVAVEAHHVGDSVTSGVEHHVVESQSAVSSNTVCQEPPQDGKQKRMPQRRRSSRLNQGSCEIRGVSQNTLHENPVVPVAPSTLSLEKQYGQTTGKHMKSLQNECSATVHEVIMASEFEKTEINELPQKTDLKEIPEACSSETEVQSHKIGDKAFNSKQNHLTGSQSSLSFNTVDTPEPPEDNTVKRCSKKRSSIEDVNAKLDTITSEPLRHEEKRKSRRKISARLNSVSSEHTDIVVETEHKDVIVSLAGSTSNVSMEQRTNQEQDGDCFSRKSNENQILGRRSLRRAAEKVVSYKEMPLNVKMRRP